MAFSHGDGCGHVIGPDTDQLQRNISGVLAHPNVAAAVIVGLGCEVNLVEFYLPEGRMETGSLTGLTLQQGGGTRATLEAAVKVVERHIERAAALKRTEVPASPIILGLNCGGSDSFSGISANPALGICSDHLAAIGATAVLAETPEIFGAEHLLVRRARDRATAERSHLRPDFAFCGEEASRTRLICSIPASAMPRVPTPACRGTACEWRGVFLSSTAPVVVWT